MKVTKEDATKNNVKWITDNLEKPITDNSYHSPRISSEFCDCGTPLSLDIYNLCSGMCQYCFAFTQKSNNPSIDINNFKAKSINVERLIKIFEGNEPENAYYKYFIKKRKILHIGGMADNFCNFERKNMKGFPLIEYLLKTGYPTVISTKFIFNNIPEYKALFEKYKDTAKMAIQASIITGEENLAKDIEIGIPKVEDRINQLRWLKSLGYYTVLRLRPFLIGVSDINLKEFLEKCTDAVDAISTEFYCLDFRATFEDRKRYEWMSKICGFDIMNYYNKLSPTSRGTYKRLNRNVKEKYIKIMYKWARDNNINFGCSDPDFKELNDFASCCCIPDDWGTIKNQLTNVLRLARIKHYAREDKSKPTLIYLKDVVVDEDEEEWKYEHKFIADEICKTSINTSELSRINHAYLFKKRWNNPNNINSPYMYFDGKMKPKGLDEEGNVIYEYIESPYEKKWREEGLL